MKKLTRRSLMQTAGLSGLAAGVGMVSGSSAVEARAQRRNTPTSGPLSQASVTFGAWMANEGLDRMDTAFDPITANHHTLAPHEVTIRAGGSVSYIVSGFHQIAVYENGTQPADIDTSNLILSQGVIAPPFPILIDDPNGRIYRGADPGNLPLDRVESVHFSTPGTYLVICTIIFHFVNDGMYGFVKVLP